MPPPRQATTSLQLNPVEAPESQRTYIILGTRRGGTSMIAGVFRALGLDLGVPGNRKNNEDPRFQNRHVEKMREGIAETNAEKDVWGWKFPAAGGYLPDVWASLRNPYFVIVYRDPVATALSGTRFDAKRARRTERLSLHESSANSNLNTGFALSVDRPCLLISHERATHDPNALIDDVADFLGVEVSDDIRKRILEYVEPGHYKLFSDFFGADSGDTAPDQQEQPAPATTEAAQAAPARKAAAKKAPAKKAAAKKAAAKKAAGQKGAEQSDRAAGAGKDDARGERKGMLGGLRQRLRQ